MSNKELFENVAKGRSEDLKKFLNQKRKLEHDLDVVEFKIKLLTRSLDDIYLDDCPISNKHMYILINYGQYKNLSEFWIDGEPNIQLRLSLNGFHEGMEQVMESVRKILKMIKDYSE